MDVKTKRLLRRYADLYENEGFLSGDPSQFMHRVRGAANQEATAFVASSLSFGSRAQFLPKIQRILDMAGGDVDAWVRSGAYADAFGEGDGRCFYRFFTYAAMRAFFDAYRSIMREYGTLGGLVEARCGGDAGAAVSAICAAFRERGACAVVPKSPDSACKRVCMFLRWMVRSGSPVDLGLWSGFVDRRTLVMPLDTHVIQEARRLGLMRGGGASMSAARRLTAALAEAFPDDPARADFALFGYGVGG